MMPFQWQKESICPEKLKEIIKEFINNIKNDKGSERLLIEIENYN